jgi:hypothetical protein
MNQVEFLLRLAENAQDQGDELALRHTAERAAHTKQLSELYRMLELAMQNLHAEMQRWGVIQPKALKLPESEPAQAQLPASSGPGGGPYKPGAGGGNASQGRLVAKDDQREHPRAAPPRQ